jgi:hypothetical protein
LGHYVREVEGQDDWHPFFNVTPSVDEAERSFVREYDVDYLLAGPAHAPLIARKLAVLGAPASVEFEVEGYVLYRLAPRTR